MDKKKANSKVSQGTEADVNHTSSKAQRARMLERLQASSVTTIEARRELNILMPGARIKELREAGHLILTYRIEADDDSGRKHYGIARYVLIKLAGDSMDGRGAE